MTKGSDIKNDKTENENYQPLFSLKREVRKSSEYFNQLFASIDKTTPSKLIDVNNLTLAKTNQIRPEPTRKEEKKKVNYSVLKTTISCLLHECVFRVQ